MAAPSDGTLNVERIGDRFVVVLYGEKSSCSSYTQCCSSLSLTP